MEEDNLFTLATQSTNGGVIGTRLYTVGGGADAWAGSPPTAATWVHVASVYNGSNVTTYINGVAQTPSALTGNTLGPIQGNVTIGMGVSSDDRVWKGLIDEVAVWNRALTQGELDTLSAGANQAVTYRLASKVIDMGDSFTAITGTLTGTNLSGAVLEISPTGSGSWCTITSGVAASATDCGITGNTFYYRVTLTDVDSSVSNVDFAWSNEDAEPSSNITYYVSPSGSDGNAGTAQSPFKTIQHAITVTTDPGTAIVVDDGTYNEQPVIYQKNGTAQDRMILKAAPGASPVIDGTGKTESFGLRLFHSSYWTIDGFEVTNVDGGSGIQTDDADHVLIKNNKVHHNDGVGILVMASDDATVQYNEVYRNGLGIKVTTETLDNVLVRSERPLVRYNIVYKNLLSGGGADGIDVMVGEVMVSN
jgi:parallel beta-helix repeat protein